jgi:hypothetical protein
MAHILYVESKPSVRWHQWGLAAAVGMAVVLVSFVLGIGSGESAPLRTGSTASRDSSLDDRLRTYARAKTDWGMNPFRQGSPITTDVRDDYVHVASLEWNPRQLLLANGRLATYTFGAGNPPEADPLSAEEKEAFSRCAKDEPVMFGSGCPGSGYVTAKVETALVQLLASKDWARLLNACESDFRKREFELGDEMRLFNEVTSTGYFDINSWLNIDPETGRKTLTQRYFDTYAWLITSILAPGDDSPDSSALNSCPSSNGGAEVAALLRSVERSVLQPL